MVRYSASLFIFACVNTVLCLQTSCGAEQEAAAPQGAAGCGCGNARRASFAAADPAEDGTGSSGPAAKYSRGANEAQREVIKILSEVRCD